MKIPSFHSGLHPKNLCSQTLVLWGAPVFKHITVTVWDETDCAIPSRVLFFYSSRRPRTSGRRWGKPWASCTKGMTAIWRSSGSRSSGASIRSCSPSHSSGEFMFLFFLMHTQHITITVTPPCRGFLQKKALFGFVVPRKPYCLRSESSNPHQLFSSFFKVLL